MIINTFPGGAIRSYYAAMDTETKTYIDGKILSEEKIKRMCGEVAPDGKPKYPVQWWREHAEVKCWAWIIWTPEGWAIAETFDEWCQLITAHRIKAAWFYYAPFDFSIIDSECLRRGWKHVQSAENPGEYSELSNDYGARYTLELCLPYTPAKGERTTRKKWRVKFYDLRNIFSGGLSGLLRDFDVKDERGREIRKLEMDYQGAAASESDIEYMEADAKGLWYLIQEAGEKMRELYGFDIRGTKPDILTASGLAKKVVLREMYPTTRIWKLNAEFSRHHPMNLELDAKFRRGGLLGGGKVIVNPEYRATHLRGIEAWRHDVNSEYPWYMSQMRSVFGNVEQFPSVAAALNFHKPHDCFILEISEIYATVKENMVPAWRDPFTGATLSTYIHDSSRPPFFMFIEELNELAKYWYDILRIKIDRVWVYPTQIEPAIRRVMLREYDGKTSARVSGDKALMTFHKLVMNGFGGKYSQNPNRAAIIRSLGADGIVHRESGEIESSEKSLMHIVQGARITCGGRVHLMQEIRRVCGEDVRHNLLYTDTDSIHALKKADYTSPTELGALKLENKTPIVQACFLAPKTYYEIEESGEIELHAKGIRTEAIRELLARGTRIEDIYSPGFCVQSLSALNVRGGKALLPFPKSMTNLTDISNIDEKYD